MLTALNLSIANERLGGKVLLLESAYNNNARQPISPKELRQGVKEFVNVDFFLPPPLSFLKVRGPHLE
jgi:hypothetical protein